MGIEVERLEYAVAATGIEQIEKTFKKVEIMVESTAKGASQKFKINYSSEEFKKKTEEFKKGFQSVGDNVSDAAEKVNKSFSKLDLTLTPFAEDVVAEFFKQTISLGTQAAKVVFSYTAAMETSENQFSQLLRNSNLAKQHLAELRQFSLQTGQDFDWVKESAKDFERLRTSTGEVLGILKAVANAVAGTGGGQKEKEAVISAITDVIKVKRATLETVEALENAGVHQSLIWETLRKETGKSNEELVLMAQNGKISSTVFLDAFKKMSEAKFGDAMKKEQATFSSAMNSIAENSKDAASKTFQPWFDGISSLTQRFAEWYRKPETQVSLRQSLRDALFPTLQSRWRSMKTAEKELREIENAKNYPKPIDYSRPPGYPGSQPPTQDSKEFNAREYLRQLEIKKQNLQNHYSEQFDIISQNLKKQETELGSHLRLTAQDEINYLVNQKNLKDYYLNFEINQQKQFFDKQIALAKGYPEAIAKLTTEKNNKIRGLNTELYLNETNTQKAIQEAQRRILEQQRQDIISFKSIEIRELRQGTVDKTFDLERTIGLGGDVQSKFDELKTITQNSYDSIVKSTKESYAVQLQNERLTLQQKINLNKEAYLTLAELAEANRERLQQIEDRKRDDSLQKLGRSLDRQLELENQYATQSQARMEHGLFLVQAIGGDFRTFGEDIKKEIKELVNAGIDGNSLQIQGLGNVGKLFESAKNKPFEKVELENLDADFNNQLKIFTQRRKGLNTQLEEYKKYGKDTTDIEHQIKVLSNDEHTARIQNAIAYNQKYFQTLDGLKEKKEAIHLGKLDIEAQNTAQKNIVNDQINSYQEIATLKERIAKFDEIAVLDAKKLRQQNTFNLKNLDYQTQHFWDDSAARQEIKFKEYRIGLLQKEEDALTRIKIAQDQLAKKWKVSHNQINASILDVLASQKSLTEIFAEAESGAVQDAFSLVDSSVHSLAQSLGIADTAAGRFFETMLSGLAKLALNKLFQMLFNSQPAQNGESSSGGGGWLSKVLNWGISALFGSFGGKLFGGTASKIGGLTDSTKGIITNIPGMNLAAEGGSFSSGDPVIVGEQGWELFIPKTSGTIYNQRQLKSMSYAPNYNFPKSYTAQAEANRNSANGGAVYHAEIHNHFHANKQTGAFSRASAEQTANQMSQLQQHAFKRSNKTN